MVVPEPFRMLPPHPREAELAANRFSSFEHYREWLANTSGDVGILVCLYDPDYGYAAVLGEKLDRHRQLLYLVRTQPCPVRRVHLPRLHEAGRIKSGLAPGDRDRRSTSPTGHVTGGMGGQLGKR